MLLQNSSSHSYQVCLRCLNLDKTYEPIQEIGEEYGSIAPRMHCQQLEHLEELQQDLLPVLPSVTIVTLVTFKAKLKSLKDKLLA